MSQSLYERQMQAISRSLNTIIQVSDNYHGLFASILDLKTNSIPFNLPPAIKGQRECDRAFPGSNLMHDHIVLKLMIDLTNVLGERHWETSAERYLRYWALHCAPTTPTGFFPWGEHSFWNLMEDRPGNSYATAGVATMATHDHLMQAPAWLWEKIWQMNPAAAERFCQALSRHFLDVDEPPEYNRHANLLQPHHLKRNRGVRSCDFPRHGGLFIYDWSFAYAQTRSAMYRHLIRRMLDYWWDRRTPGYMLPEATRNGLDYPAANAMQTLSLSVSLLQAAELIQNADTALAQVMRERALEYLNTVLDAPHDLDNGKFVIQMNRQTGQVHAYANTWASYYSSFGVLVSNVASLLLCAYRVTQEQRLLDVATPLSEHCAQSQMPVEVAVPVKDAGMQLSLLADMFSLTGDRKWLDHGQRWAEQLMPIYLDHDLPRAALGSDIYDSQLLPGHFLRGLTRLALQSQGKDIGPDYTLR